MEGKKKVGRPKTITTPDERIRELIISENPSVRSIHRRLILEGYQCGNHVTVWKAVRRITEQLLAEGFRPLNKWEKY